MNIVIDIPPIYSRACETFDLDGVIPVFTYGDTIYNPHGSHLDAALLAHELIHSCQQGDDPAGWWDRYFTDVPFRVAQEIGAYQAQYRTAKRTIKDRNTRYRYLRMLAQDLSSSMYGNILTFDQALRSIQGA